MKNHLFYIFAILLIVVALGCGSGGSSDDSNSNSGNLPTVSVTGYVSDGTNASIRASEARYKLNNNLSGITVHVEGRRDLYATTDSNGKFIINNVPIGKQSFIAEKQEMGRTAYRQRLSSINLEDSKSVFEITEPISIVSSPYSNVFMIKDPSSGKPIPYAKAVIWDTEYTADSNGKLSVTDFPGNIYANITISASNYNSYTTRICFGENQKATSEILLCKTGTSQKYPVVSIEYKDTSAIYLKENKLYIEPNTYINLEAMGYDPNEPNTPLEWDWSATKGSFNSASSNKSISYMAPNNCEKVVITLSGRNQERNRSVATLEFYIDKTDPSDPEPPVIPGNHQPYPVTNLTPANQTKNIPCNQQVEFSWQCAGDPDDGDTVTYFIYLKKNNYDFSNIAITQKQQYSYTKALSDNTEFSWYVKATDQVGSSTVSDVWTFTTVDLDGMNIITPTTITEALKLEFKKSVSNATIDFLPSVEGNWNWSSDKKTAEFKPKSGSWLPGSYNTISIDAENIIYSDGKKNKSSISTTFELPSDLPIPTGYRSYAFPMEVEANETVKCEIPLLKKGNNAYAILVNTSNAANNTTISNAAIIAKDPTYKFRLQELELRDVEFPDIVKNGRTSLANASLNAHAINESKTFKIDRGDDQWVGVTTRLVNFNQTALVYAEEALGPTSASIQERAQILLNEFSKSGGIKETDEAYFGNAPTAGPDGEERISIVLFQGLSTSNTIGYFSPNDLYEVSKNVRSNGCKAIYFNNRYEMDFILPALPHEYQHLIYFYNKKMLGSRNTNNDTWLTESLSKYSEEINGYDIDNNSNTVNWIYSSLQTRINTLSLTEWTGDEYGMVYLFMHFLAQPNRYMSDSKSVTKALVASKAEDAIKDVESVTGEPFKTTLAKWALSLQINDWNSSSPKAYGINNINLTGKYSGVTLPGLNITDTSKVKNPVSIKANGLYFVKTTSTDAQNTTSIKLNCKQAADVYFLDERDY